MEFDDKLPPSNGLLRKGAALWRRSKIWAPFIEEESQGALGEIESIDLKGAAPGAPPLDQACQALSGLISQGYTLRAVGPHEGDRSALFEHWMGLGIEGLRTRFFYHPSAFMLKKRAQELDFNNPRFAGIFGPAGELACVAEWAFDTETLAEAAFSTLPAHRRKGLAKVAAAACAIDARAGGVLRLRIDTLRENIAAQGLAERLGGAKQAFPSGMGSDCVTSTIDLTQSGPLSIEGRMGILGTKPLGTKPRADH